MRFFLQPQVAQSKGQAFLGNCHLPALSDRFSMSPMLIHLTTCVHALLKLPAVNGNLVIKRFLSFIINVIM